MKRPTRSDQRHHALSLDTLVIVAMLFSAAVPFAHANAQTQGTKPDATATTIAPEPASGDPGSGVNANAYMSPGFGFGVNWDAGVWVVEDEAGLAGYEGIQLGTDVITVYVEGYDDFSGNPRECLGEATLQIVGREGVTEFQPLTNRDLPVATEDAGEAALFLYRLSFESGQSLEVIEYIDCRTLVPGQSVLEITVQMPVQVYEESLPAVAALLASVTLPGEAPTGSTGTPAAATPVDDTSLGRSVPIQGADHVAEGAAHEPYATTPPTSGPHWGRTAEWGVSATPVANELQVHNLEHGGVMLQYSCDCPEVIALLERFANPATGYPVLVIAAPYPYMEADVALTAWGQILELSAEEVTADQVRAFVEAFIDQGPEQIHSAELEAWRVSDAPKP